jgi:hypothetical protein
MNYLAVIKPTLVIAAISAVIGFSFWAATTFTVMKTVIGDDYLLMTDKQAKECKEGGGCAIFSEREFSRTVNAIIAQQRPRL